MAPSYAVIDRVDAAGAVRSTSLWEYVYISAIAGNTLTITRAQGGSTGQAHSNGAVIEAVVTAAAWEDLRLSYLNEHGSEGAHVSIASSNWFETRNFVVPSIASIADLRTPVLNIPSVATIALLNSLRALISTVTIRGLINASGASVLGDFPSSTAAGPTVVQNRATTISRASYADTFVAVATLALGVPRRMFGYTSALLDSRNTSGAGAIASWQARILDGTTVLGTGPITEIPASSNARRVNMTTFSGVLSTATIIFTLECRNTTDTQIFIPDTLSFEAIAMG